MKKISLSIIAVAALLVAVTFTGCTREESKEGNGPATLVLKIRQGETRANTTAVGATTITLNDGFVFVTNGSNRIVHALQIVPNSATAGQVNVGDLTNGSGTAVFTLPAGATNVHVFGNVADVAAWTAKSITAANAIGKLITDYTEDIDIKVADLSVTNGVAKVPLYGTDDISPNGSNYESEPQVSPVAARIEITKISALEEKVATFKLAGIYVNAYYPARDFSGGDGVAVKNNGQDDTKYAVSSEYNGLSGILCDEYTTVLTPSIGTGVVSIAPSSNIWAYNLTVPKTTAHYFPHLVLKLTEVSSGTKATNSISNETKFLTVKNVVDNSGILKFTKGNIYRIANIVFTDTDLYDDPEPLLGTLAVEATLVPWEFKDVSVSF
jgi:hypothetical protein